MQALRALPKIDKLMSDGALAHIPSHLCAKLCKEVVGFLREELLRNSIGEVNKELAAKEVLRRYEALIAPSLVKTINATGIVVHTNLGRSPISKQALSTLGDIVGGYCNLEYDLTEGKRGDRYGHLQKEIAFLLSSEDSLLVNNNAAAVFLILNTFAKKKGCVVSRGELVEIGGGFRVPQVMAQSGAKLVEVGTTNKTRLSDYENAIDDKTAVLMKVHRSNFSIEGFSEEVEFEEITKLACKYGLVDYYDLGSGMMDEFLPHGVSPEPILPKVFALNPSLVSFSADKLLGGIQAGIIVGKKELIDKLKKNQLLRMLRVDKITIHLTASLLRSYILGHHDEIPTVQMLSLTLETLTAKAEKIAAACKEFLSMEIVQTHGFAGGGSLPNRKIDSIALKVNSKHKPKKLESLLRQNRVIARIEQDTVMLDMRTVFDDEIPYLIEVLKDCENER